MRSAITRRVSLVLVAWFCTIAPATAGQDRRAPAAAAIDEMVSRLYPASGTGAAIIVVKDGKTILRKGYGLADVELGVPVRPEMVFRIGSVTKQFTAALVMMLVEEGKLSVDDEITKFLPDYPTQGRKITVEHLLTHTSGIVSYTGMPRWRTLLMKDMSVAEMTDMFKNEPMEFAPGEKWSYDNSGYFLLGAIIEKITGKRYADAVNERIFAPLGMTHSFYGETAPLIAGRVHGYEYRRGQAVNAGYISMTQPYAAGALVSSVDDLAVWDAALSAGTVLKPAVRDRMFANHALKDGRKTNYGYGWMLASYEGRAVQEHGGGITGFTCYVVRIPEEKLYAAFLTNESGGARSPSLVAQRAAAVAMGKPWVEPAEVKLEAAALEPLVGVYQGARGKYTVARDGLRLSLQRDDGRRISLVPASSTQFFTRQALMKVAFVKASTGAVTGLSVSGWTVPDAAVRAAEKIK